MNATFSRSMFILIFSLVLSSASAMVPAQHDPTQRSCLTRTRDAFISLLQLIKKPFTNCMKSETANAIVSAAIPTATAALVIGAAPSASYVAHFLGMGSLAPAIGPCAVLFILPMAFLEEMVFLEHEDQPKNKRDELKQSIQSLDLIAKSAAVIIIGGALTSSSHAITGAAAIVNTFTDGYVLSRIAPIALIVSFGTKQLIIKTLSIKDAEFKNFMTNVLSWTTGCVSAGAYAALKNPKHIYALNQYCSRDKLLALPGPLLLTAVSALQVKAIIELISHHLTEADQKAIQRLALVPPPPQVQQSIYEWNDADLLTDDARLPEDPNRPSRSSAPGFSIWHMSSEQRELTLASRQLPPPAPPRTEQITEEDTDEGAITPTLITVTPNAKTKTN